MKKKVSKVIDCIGDAELSGFGVVIAYLGFKLIKFALSELEYDFKR